MVREPLDAVLLDFDHTLAHVGQLVRWDDARAAMLPIYRRSGVAEEFLKLHGGALSLYGDIAASGLLPEEELRSVQQEASAVLERLEEETIPNAALIPAAIEFVRRLPSLELRTGIVSSNTAELVWSILERDGIATAFETIVGRGDVSRLKPSPEGLLLCCERMDVVPQRCIYAGDSVSDIEAAHAAGMAGFGVRGGVSPDVELERAGAAAVFDDLGGLQDVLERQNGR
jgi:phosphoglycolate phosphatase